MHLFFQLALLSSLMLSGTFASADDRPDIVLIVADDVGFSDIGVYGGEIRTPNIDALADKGIQLTNFQAAPTCGPSRTMMLTGIDHHRVGAGINTAGLMRLPHLRGRPGYEGYLNDDVVTFATLLKDSGYHTFMTANGIREIFRDGCQLTAASRSRLYWPPVVRVTLPMPSEPFDQPLKPAISKTRTR